MEAKILVYLCVLFVTADALENYIGNSTEWEPRQISRLETDCTCYYQDSCGCICLRPISYEEFQALPQNFNPCRSFTFALRGGKFYSFPSNYFYRVGHVKDFVLDISRISFQYLSDPEGESSPFNGVTFDVSAYLRLHELSVSRDWNWDALYWLAPTNPSAYCEVQVMQSTVPVLRVNFGRVCQGAVTVAAVVNSNLHTIENRAFASFYKLLELDLASNRIQDVRRSFFAYPANALEIINLSYNQLRTLPPDIFTQMPRLQSVDLRGNPLTSVDERAFRPILNSVEILGLRNETTGFQYSFTVDHGPSP